MKRTFTLEEGKCHQIVFLWEFGQSVGHLSISYETFPSTSHDKRLVPISPFTVNMSHLHNSFIYSDLYLNKEGQWEQVPFFKVTLNKIYNKIHESRCNEWEQEDCVFTHLSLLAQHDADISCFLCSGFVVNKWNHTNKWDQLLLKGLNQLFQCGNWVLFRPSWQWWRLCHQESAGGAMSPSPNDNIISDSAARIYSLSAVILM